MIESIDLEMPNINDRTHPILIYAKNEQVSNEENIESSMVESIANVKKKLSDQKPQLKNILSPKLVSFSPK
jgi:hypothetical protein